MKNILFLMFLLPFSLFAEKGNPTIDAIANALKTGNVTALAAHFEGKVEVSIMDNEKTVSSAEAKKLVNDFFAKNTPTGYKAMHAGQSRENSDQYCIGNLESASGTFRVYIYLKNEGGKLSISELRFDKG